METSRNKSIAIAAFMLGGMIAAGWLIFKFGDAPRMFTGGGYDLRINFKQIGITKVGTEVLLAGKRIGEVMNIGFIDPNNLARGVQVTAQIETQYRLPRSAHALESVTSAVMGRAVIQILLRDAPSGGDLLPADGSGQIQGEVQPLLDNILPPTMVPTMEQAIRRIGDLADAMTPVARELESLIKSRPLKEVDQVGTQAALANLSTVMQRFDITLKNINVVLGDTANQTNLKDTLANFRKASDRLNEVLDQANRLASDLRVIAEDVRGGVKDIRGFVTKADGMLDGLAGSGMDTMEAIGRTALEFEELARRANQGQGTLGMLANDNRLYESMLLTTERMSKALDDLRAVLEQAKRGDLRIKMF